MTNFLVILASLFIIFGLMMLSLKLGKYKEKSSGCCGGGHCAVPTPESSGDACCGKHEH